MLLIAAVMMARQFIILQHPIRITIRPMKHGDQAGIKFMLFDHPVFVVIQRGKAATLACGKVDKADRAIVIGVKFLGVYH